MKNKLLLINIISYVIIYHVVYEFIYYFFLAKGDLGITPIGFIFEYLGYKNRGEGLGFIIIIISFIINMSMNGILLRYIYKWDEKKSFLQLFKKLLLVFVIVSVILIVLLFLLAAITKSMVFFIFISCYFPMPIMAILMLPLFKLNEWILSKFSK